MDFLNLTNAELTLYSIIIFMFLENLMDLYLNKRQMNVYKNCRAVPQELQSVMSNETFEKARVYGLDKSEFTLYKVLICDLIIGSFELYLGFIARIWARAYVTAESFNLNPDNEIITACIFIVLMNIIVTLKDLPFKIYYTFTLEERHGFNKQTPMFFVIDQIKAFVVGQIITIPIISAIIYIVQIGGEYFFIWLWLFVGAVSVLLITIYPVYIAPLFDKFRPLSDGPLRTSIQELASQLKFPLGQLYVVEGSKRSAHSNAYFTGLWGPKRIVLFDTLLLNKGLPVESDAVNEEDKAKGCDDKEVLAVLAHELGHWKLGHIKKNFVIMQVQLFLVFVIFAYLFKCDYLYEAMGFRAGVQPILIGLMVITMYVLAPFNTVLSFVMTYLSRQFEYQADDFAKRLGYSNELKKALVKLNIDNLGFPVYDWLYTAMKHSHPTLLQRIHALSDKKDK